MKIYTKSGDGGETGLVGGKRLPKDDLKIDCYGTTDELNSFIGLAMSFLCSKSGPLEAELIRVQNELFSLGAYLSCQPEDRVQFKIAPPSRDMIQHLELLIDSYSEKCEPLKQFILPSGSQLISTLHVCRTVSRRLERMLVALKRTEPEHVEDVVIEYTNRLSDFFFAMGRYAAVLTEAKEVTWKGV